MTGRMKTFFDRHTGVAMVKPKDVRLAHDYDFGRKLKTFIKAIRNMGPYDEWTGTRYIIVTACTVPKLPGYLSGDIGTTISAMKIYIKKLKGRCIGKIIYADTLFRFTPKKKARLMHRMYKMGKALSGV